ncbi:MAG: GGDEF domain-containing protein [Nitrosospira sp.]
MTSDYDASLTTANKPLLLKTALERYEDVKEKMEDCALELSTVNETVKKEIGDGITLQLAEKALIQSEVVEQKVQECAGELHEVNHVLAEQIEDQEMLNNELEMIRGQLSATQTTLAITEDNLTVAHEVAEDAEQRSLRDFATGIPNRELFNDRLEQAVVLAKRNNWDLAIMFIDLDRFKLINDTHGHAVGDLVLKAVAQRLEEQVRTGDTIGRYGGDEFLYLLVNPQGKENIMRIAEKVFSNISHTLVVDDLVLTITPSIGISVYPSDGETGQKLVANADIAMYKAKESKAGFVFFDRDHAAANDHTLQNNERSDLISGL